MRDSLRTMWGCNLEKDAGEGLFGEVYAETFLKLAKQKNVKGLLTQQKDNFIL